MDDGRRLAIRRTLTITAACIVGSLAITIGITWLATGSLDIGIGLVIAVAAPAVLVPLGSYSHIALAVRLQQANDKLRTLSETDPLTHTFNRRRFLEAAHAQLALARRHGFPTSLLLIDFDRFKDINDAFGHLAGDRVLVEASEVFRGALRESDTLARFGGEEFVVLLPHTGRAGAMMVAERIVAAIRAHRFRHDGRSMRVTVSIGGVASETSATIVERMTSRADGLMYQAKQAGRDRALVENLPGESLPVREACSG